MMKNHYRAPGLKHGAGTEKYLSRRDFLKNQLKNTFYLTAGIMGLYLPKPLFASTVPDIAVVKGEAGPAAHAAVEFLGGMKAFVKPGNKVVIKPNMTFPDGPEAATITNPLVTKELVAMCREAGASRIRVLDHPIEQQEVSIQSTKRTVDGTQTDIVHALARKDFYEPASIPQGVQLKETEVMKDVLEADVLIAAPVAKSHWATGVSLSMKGMMGLIWDRMVMHRDYDLEDTIVDLCSLLKADLTVTDATRVLSTGGPRGPGRVVQMDTIIASKDMVAADAKAVQLCEWYGRRFEPRQVTHIRLAHERGLGRMDLENLKVQTVEI